MENERPNILEYIDEQIDRGMTEDDAARMWFVLFCPEEYTPEDYE